MRVLAVTGNASLVVALGSMMRDWELISVRTPEEAASAGGEAAVALIDAGETEAGLAVAERLFNIGITIPAVVIGDQAPRDDRTSVLVRPFSLEDLTTAVKLASERDAQQAPRREASSAAEPDSPATTAEPTAPAATKAPAAGGNEAAAPVEPRPARPLTVVRPEEPPAPKPNAPEIVPPAPPPAPMQQPVQPPTTPRSAQPESVAPQKPVAPAAAASPGPPVQAPPAATPRPAVAATAAVAEKQAPAAEGRWRLRRKAAPVTAEEAEPLLIRRLKAAAKELQEIGSLLKELPVLQDLRAMADALAGEIESQFSAPIASVFMRAEDGFHAVAFRGLSRVEAGMVVPETQPLFSDVLATREGILIQPVDLAQGLVAGIGGARTEALMAAPALLKTECFAIIVVGGNRFSESDLDRLSDLALEAAPGLAVAQLLQRLRDRA